MVVELGVVVDERESRADHKKTAETTAFLLIVSDSHHPLDYLLVQKSQEFVLSRAMAVLRCLVLAALVALATAAEQDGGFAAVISTPE